jgi:DNA-damage-inducible protein D
MPENKAAAMTGGGIAKNARVELESKTGNKVVSASNYLSSATKTVGSRKNVKKGLRRKT